MQATRSGWRGDDLPPGWRPSGRHSADASGRLLASTAVGPLALSLGEDRDTFRVALPEAWHAGSIHAAWEITARDARQRGDYDGGDVRLGLAEVAWRHPVSAPPSPSAVSLMTDQTTVQLLWRRVRRLPTGSWYALRKRLAGVDVFSGWVFSAHGDLAFRVASSKPATVLLQDLTIDRVQSEDED